MHFICKQGVLALWAGLFAAAAVPPGASRHAAAVSMPALFIANQGQYPDSGTLFTLRTTGLAAAFRRDGLSLASTAGRVSLRFVASRARSVESVRRSDARASFLNGSPAMWAADLPTYESIAYRELYPGIDLIYTGRKSLKSEYRVRPGAEPSAIRMRYDAPGHPYVNEDGALIIRTAAGEVQESAPEVYQDIQGRRVPVAGGFQVHGDGTVGFRLGSYDRTRVLIIDPTLRFSTYFGGNGFDAVTAVAVDLAGNCYVAGWTEASGLPVTSAAQYNSGGRIDAFVAKLTPAGALVYVTYLGGGGNDRALAIRVDASGSAVVTGSTESDNFPVINAIQSRRGGRRDAFIVRLNPAGTGILFSTYLGGAGDDAGNGVALDASGNIYVAGETASADFPTLLPYQSRSRGRQDAFVCKLSSNGGLLFSTYLGGSADDRANGIAVDGAGAAYVTGATDSLDYPILNAVQTKNSGGQDAFITKLDSSGATLAYSTYFGGQNGTAGFPEAGNSIAVDAEGNAYVAGVTSSTDFPISAALRRAFAGGSTDAFVAKLGSSGTSLLYSTYVGGSGADAATSIAIGADGSAYVSGYTTSQNFPVAQPIQGANAGLYDAFLIKLDPVGSTLIFGSYLGGSDSDSGLAVAVDSAGNVYTGGQTLSYNFPLMSALQNANPGNYGGFIAKVSFGGPPSEFSASPASGTGSSQTFRLEANDPDGWQDITTVYAIVAAGSPVARDSCYVAYLPGANLIYVMNDNTTGWLGPVTPGSAGILENSQCRILAAQSSRAGAGQAVILNLAVMFKPSYAGPKNIYVTAQDRSGTIPPWAKVGTWTVPYAANEPPLPVSVAPAMGSGPGQVFQITAADPEGAADLTAIYVMVAAVPGVNSSCYMAYLPQGQSVYLFNDGGTGWLTPIALGSATTAENAQCAISAQGSSSFSVGNSRILNLDLRFKSAYAGQKNIFVAAQDTTGNVSGWVKLAAWNVTGGAVHAPSPVSVAPASGTGRNAIFSFTASDPDGAAAILATYMIIAAGPDAAASCYMAYVANGNSVYLMNDNVTGWLGPVALGSAGSVENGQCRVTGTASTATTAQNTVTVSLDVAFKSAYAGAKNLYLAVQDVNGVIAGWARVGTWTVI